MKLRSTTPASVPLATKLMLAFASVLILISVPLQIAQKVFADQFDDQISALQQEINNYNAQAAKLDQQAQTLQSAVDQLQAQASAIQAQIDLSQAKYNKLVQQITDTEKQIKDNQDALGVTIANMYVDDKISPIEMLASSKTISDYMDQEEYQSSIRDQLTSTISKIKDLKSQLIKQQTAVKTVLDEQSGQKASLTAKQAQQQDLLNQTQGQESAYEQLVASNNQKLADVASEQRAYYQSRLSSGSGVNSGVVGSFQYANWSGNEGCSGGYPYCGAMDSGIDPWGLYNRECVSYVAWALSARFGRNVQNFSGEGNAYQWPYSAPEFSGAVRVYDPQPGDAVVLPQSGGFAPMGHLMIVESVSSDWIHVSQFNFYGTGEYSTMDIKNSGVIFLRFPPN
ncbi:MAG TPA: CHAP domain-containing protein [Candidatus Saccharimonadales bacterium]|nr:CHAP domain-containing protein [Candidatus Saccharimonadales bacterium]